jgi:plastocyanin
MHRVTTKLTLATASGALALLAALGGVATAGSAGAPKQVTGSVGPGFAIKLSLGGKPVTKLKAGVAYKFTVKDQAAIHDFHLTGPGVDKVITTVPFTGTKSVVLTLKRGTYRYVCDPHASSMKGSFTVA